MRTMLKDATKIKVSSECPLKAMFAAKVRRIMMSEELEVCEGKSKINKEFKGFLAMLWLCVGHVVVMLCHVVAMLWACWGNSAAICKHHKGFQFLPSDVYF